MNKPEMIIYDIKYDVIYPIYGEEYICTLMGFGKLEEHNLILILEREGYKLFMIIYLKEYSNRWYWKLEEKK